MKLKRIITAVLILVISFLGFNYYRQLESEEHFKKQSILLKQYYQEFGLQYKTMFPKNKSDFKTFYNWLDIHHKESIDIHNKNELIVYHDSLAKKTILYEAEKNDTILVLINEGFPCNELAKTNDRERLDLFQVHSNMKSILHESEKEENFLNLIYGFEKKYNVGLESSNKLSILFFLYEKGRVSVVCNDGLSDEDTQKIRFELEDYIKNQGVNYFDHAYFAVRIFSN